MSNNKLLLEFNRSDLETVVSNNDSFTIAYEIELETDEDALLAIQHGSGGPATYEKINNWALQNQADMPTKIVLDVIDFEKLLDEYFEEKEEEVKELIVDSAIEDGGVTDRSVEELVRELTKLNDLTNIDDEDREVRLIFVKNILKNEKIRETLNEILPIQISDPNQTDMFDHDDVESLVRYLESLSDRDHFDLLIGSVLNNLSTEEFKKIMEEIWDKKFEMLKSDYIDELDLSLDEEKEYFDELKDILILDPDQLNDKIFDIRNKILEDINGRLDPSSDFYYAKDDIPDIFDEAGVFDIEGGFVDKLDRELSDYDEQLSDAFAHYLESVGADNFFEEFDFLEGYREDIVGNSLDELDDFLRSNKEEIFASAFPNFWSKWGSDLYITEDGSLDRGIEVVHGSYLGSIEEAMEFLDDFYAEYNKQTVFMFDEERTGLHTNVGYKGNSYTDDWNLFKAYLFLNESFATRGFEDRLDNSYSGPIKKIIENYLEGQLGQPLDSMNYNVREIIMKIAEKNPDFFSSIEESMNNIIHSQAARSTQYSGFSVRSNRVEFRYPGGEMNKADLKSATMYYCYLVELATNPEYKRREYLLKAVKFVAKTISEMKEGTSYPYKNTQIKITPKFAAKYLDRFIRENGPYIVSNRGSYLNIPGLFGHELSALSCYLNEKFFKDNFSKENLINYSTYNELAEKTANDLNSKDNIKNAAIINIVRLDEDQNVVEIEFCRARTNSLFTLIINGLEEDQHYTYSVSMPSPVKSRTFKTRMDKLAWLIQNNDIRPASNHLRNLNLLFSDKTDKGKMEEFMNYVDTNLYKFYKLMMRKPSKIVRIHLDNMSNEDKEIYETLNKIK
jgi:hypothetical protein